MNLAKRILATFADHPASVGETYLEHAHHSAYFGLRMLQGAGAAFVHAVFPAICTSTAGAIARVIERFQNLNVLPRRVIAEFGIDDIIHIEVDVCGMPEE
jgi:hypothetical protein